MAYVIWAENLEMFVHYCVLFLIKIFILDIYFTQVSTSISRGNVMDQEKIDPIPASIDDVGNIQAVVLDVMFRYDCYDQSIL